MMAMMMCEWISDWIDGLVYDWNYGGHLRNMAICHVIIVACAILQVLIVVYHTVSFFTRNKQESEELGDDDTLMIPMMIPLMIAGGFDGVEPLDEAKCYVSFGNSFTRKAIERFHSELKKRLSKEGK